MSDAFVATVLSHFDADPVVSLDRRGPPTHLVVRSVHRGAVEAVVVAFDLIDAPPTPSAVAYGGSFGAAELPPTRAWWPFDPSLGVEENVACMRDFVRDAIRLCGRASTAPRGAVDPPALSQHPRAQDGPARTFERSRPAPPPEPPPPTDAYAKDSPAAAPAQARLRPASSPPPAPKPRGSAPAPARASSPSSSRGSSPRSSRGTSPPPAPRSGPPEPPPPRPLFGDDEP